MSFRRGRHKGRQDKLQYHYESKKIQIPVSKEPLNTTPPSPSDIDNEKCLSKVLSTANKLQECDSERRSRELALRDLSDICDQWVRDSAAKKGFPEDFVNSSCARLYAFGSYRIGVHSEGDDIDVLCAGPRFLDRNYFFEELGAELNNNCSVKNFNCVPEAYVPVMNFKYNGVDIDMVYAQLQVDIIEESWDLFDDRNLRNLDSKSIYSLNGTRLADKCLKLVPNRANFQLALRAIRHWAKSRAIYSNKIGYLGGVAWNILTARVCQLYPNANAAQIVQNFFLFYHWWDFKSPMQAILLCELETHDDMPIQVPAWDPQDPKYGRDIMHIITPAFPSMNSTHNVSIATYELLKKEFARGFHLISGLNKLNETQWQKLFQPTSFFIDHKYYIFIKASAPTKVATGWHGFVESKLRTFVHSIEQFPDVIIVPYNTGIQWPLTDNGLSPNPKTRKKKRKLKKKKKAALKPPPQSQQSSNDTTKSPSTATTTTPQLASDKSIDTTTQPTTEDASLPQPTPGNTDESLNDTTASKSLIKPKVSPSAKATEEKPQPSKTVSASPKATAVTAPVKRRSTSPPVPTSNSSHQSSGYMYAGNFRHNRRRYHNYGRGNYRGGRRFNSRFYYSAESNVHNSAATTANGSAATAVSTSDKGASLSAPAPSTNDGSQNTAVNSSTNSGTPAAASSNSTADGTTKAGSTEAKATKDGKATSPVVEEIPEYPLPTVQAHVVSKKELSCCSAASNEILMKDPDLYAVKAFVFGLHTLKSQSAHFDFTHSVCQFLGNIQLQHSDAFHVIIDLVKCHQLPHFLFSERNHIRPTKNEMDCHQTRMDVYHKLWSSKKILSPKEIESAIDIAMATDEDTFTQRQQSTEMKESIDDDSTMADNGEIQKNRDSNAPSPPLGAVNATMIGVNKRNLSEMNETDSGQITDIDNDSKKRKTIGGGISSNGNLVDFNFDDSFDNSLTWKYAQLLSAKSEKFIDWRSLRHLVTARTTALVESSKERKWKTQLQCLLSKHSWNGIKFTKDFTQQSLRDFAVDIGTNYRNYKLK